MSHTPGQNPGSLISMAELPPGPSAPSVVQTLAWWNRPLAYLERQRARFGNRWVDGELREQSDVRKDEH